MDFSSNEEHVEYKGWWRHDHEEHGQHESLAKSISAFLMIAAIAFVWVYIAA